MRRDLTTRSIILEMREMIAHYREAGSPTSVPTGSDFIAHATGDRSEVFLTTR